MVDNSVHRVDKTCFVSGDNGHDVSPLLYNIRGLSRRQLEFRAS